MNAGTAILEAFYQAAGQFVQNDELARLLKQPVASVVAEIADLEKLGYKIEAHPHLGYRLLEAPDRLTADDIKARLETVGANSIRHRSRLQTAPTTARRAIGSEILVFEQTSSTNDVVEHMARTGVDEGLVVFAESQTRGRGRHGRAWASPRGKGLWFSVLLRPKLTPTAAPRITVAASVAVARAIRSVTGLNARIKWPNDVTVRGKKAAGILTELRDVVASVSDAELFATGTAAITTAILGIGIDVNCRLEDFPPEVSAIATSLLLETGQPQDRVAIAAATLSALDALYAAAQTDFEAVVEEWARLCTTLGKQLVVTMGVRRIEGCAQALDDDGALLLRKDNGQIERILGADVVVERE